MKIIISIILLISLTVCQQDCFLRGKNVKKPTMAQKKNYAPAGCKGDCRSVLGAMQEAEYMICKFEQLNSIAKMNPTLNFALMSNPQVAKGWIRFVYSMEKPPGSANSTSANGFPIKYLVKVCVPVLKSRKSWVDNSCALDFCDDLTKAWNQPCITNDQTL
jgi:hypothetical protein